MLGSHISPTGRLQVPVLTLHTTADPHVPVENEQAYASVVRAAGNSALLRQLFVQRAGHCTFTAAEEITAFQTLMQRLETGRWAQQHLRHARGLFLGHAGSDGAAVKSQAHFAPSR